MKIYRYQRFQIRMEGAWQIQTTSLRAKFQNVILGKAILHIHYQVI